jgi:sulfite exporter TauE/SafE
MYQPYPTGAQMPDVQRPPIPPQVINAVRTMYVGAAASLLGIVIDILTVKATKSAIEKRSHHLTASQITSTQHVLVIGFIAGGVIGAVVWIFLAKACQRGQSWARITGTVLFALATVDTLIGLSAPIAGAVKVWALVTWLAGLTAVIFLWQRPSTAFFKGANNQ